MVCLFSLSNSLQPDNYTYIDSDKSVVLIKNVILYRDEKNTITISGNLNVTENLSSK